ncbi:hypothetical protein BaRGS_00003819, partial [Batillaria attramentaria]
LYSSYKFYKLQIHHLKSSREDFHDWAKEQFKLITDCFNEFGIRRCAYNATFSRPVSCRPIVGIYYVYIQDWLLRFPRDQMYFVRLEDLSANVTGEMTKIFAFLKLDPVSEETMVEIESAKEANVGRLFQEFGPILPATKSLLDDFYRPFNRRLAQLLGDDRFLSSLSFGSVVHQGVPQEEPVFKTYSKIVADISDPQISHKESAFYHHFSASLLTYDGKAFPDLCKGPVGLPEARPVVKLDLTRFGPFEFLDDYRNPCWYTNASTRELQCLPYFYQAGFPKCGSTYLYQLLRKHPDVAPIMKEPQWLTRGRFKTNAIDIKPYVSRYAKPIQKSHRGASLVIGDGSASTMYENHFWYLFPGNENCSEPRVLTVDYIRHLNPGAKIIVIMRNPTNRLYSSYKFYKLQKQHLKRTREDFHDWAKEQFKLITDCFNEFGIRRCAYNATFSRPVVRS